MEGPGLRSGLAQAGRKRCLGARVRRAEALFWNRVGDQNWLGWSGFFIPSGSGWVGMEVEGEQGPGGGGGGDAGRSHPDHLPERLEVRASPLGSGLLIGSSDIGKFEVKLHQPQSL